MPENIVITSEVDPHNPEICRFTSPQTLYVGTKTVTNVDDAKGLPLAEKLISIAGLTKIQLIGHLLVATKTLNKQWTEVSKDIEAALTAYLISGQALTSEEVHDRMMLIGRSTREKVQYLIDTHINPGVAEHGGFIRVVEVNADTVYLRLGGGCQGCAAADFTLKQGIDSIIKRAVPEIQKIIDITDHSAGDHPYYSVPH
jgi:NFU1 iron-sulfur cluster scaffold homolog, mitochondrial